MLTLRQPLYKQKAFSLAFSSMTHWQVLIKKTQHYRYEILPWNFTKDKIVNCFMFRGNSGDTAYKTACLCNLLYLRQDPLQDLGGQQLSHCTWFWGVLAAVMLRIINADPESIPVCLSTQRANLPACSGKLGWVNPFFMQYLWCWMSFISRMFVSWIIVAEFTISQKYKEQMAQWGVSSVVCQTVKEVKD